MHALLVNRGELIGVEENLGLVVTSKMEGTLLESLVQCNTDREKREKRNLSPNSYLFCNEAKESAQHKVMGQKGMDGAYGKKDRS